MLGGNGAGMGTRAGGAQRGNGTGLNTSGTNTGINLPEGGRFEDREYPSEVVFSGSDQESDSGDDEDTMGSAGDRRGVKRERAEMEVGSSPATSMGLPGGYSGVAGGATGAKPGKKTRGRVKIKMEFIDNKLRRYTTFSKRKTGIMKKAYELSTLTGTQVLLLVASETGHVYTFATRKLQPMITSETGKALIQTCLNSPDSPPRSDPSTDQRMSATGFEETDLTYQVSEADGCTEVAKDMKPTFTVANLPSGINAQPLPVSSSAPSSSSSAVAMHLQNSNPATCWQVSAGINTHSTSTNGTVLKGSAAPAGVMLPGGFTLMSGAQLPPGTHTIPLSQLQALQGPLGPAGIATTHAQQGQQATLLRLPATVSLTGGGMPQQLQAIHVHPSSQQSSLSHSSSELCHTTGSSTVSLPTTIVTSSVPSSVAGHMMYPGAHTVMYATPTPSLSDGGLTVLNTFSQASHAQSHDAGAVPQVFLTMPPGAVQLHPMVIGQQSSSSTSNLTELQVVNLDAHTKDD
ncbi:serum response factor a isoform X1 [Osmerus mordax]|uniref:serum response factor a isoform X1 n=1 Tax=Osmerus mordax TaxID=8014 RepID=UPI00350F229E